VYYISTNAISTLNVPTGGTKADFSAKANIVELILDSNGAVLSTVALDGGAILQMSLDSANQTLAVQVNMSKGRGGIWYSSQWNGATTVLKAIENVIDKPIKVNGL
jgi:hypothetical protein